MTQKQEDRVPEGVVDLDDLFLEAQMAQAMKNPKVKKGADPSLRNALDAEAKKMKELYSLPENWERTRGVALIDKGTQTLLGNFSEYRHRTVPKTRRLVREHTPISIDATEVVEGYLGADVEFRLKGQSWEREVDLKADVWMDELMVGAPEIKLLIKLRLGVIIRIELLQDTQFASNSGQTLLQLPSGTNIAEQLSTDSKRYIRRQTGG